MAEFARLAPVASGGRSLPPPSSPKRRLPSVGSLMLIGMGVGAALGALLGERAAAGAFLGDLFIRLLMLAGVPLLFLNLVGAVGVARPAGRLSALTLWVGGWFGLTTLAGSLTGLASVALFRPGEGLEGVLPAGGAEAEAGAAALPGAVEFLTDLVPESVFGAFVEGRIFSVVALALLLGGAVRALEAGPRAEVLRFVDAGNALFRRLISGVLWFGPIGTAALVAASVGEYGAALFEPLGRYVVAVGAGHLAILSTYCLTLRLLARWNPFHFFRRAAIAWTTAVATSGSLATLPASLKAGERLGLPRSVYSFTLPLGAQLNKDGSGAVLCGVVLFAAQAFGEPLSLGQLATVVALGTLLTVALPGVVNGGIVAETFMLGSFGFPPGLVLLLAGVYRLVDISMTVVNISGDLVATAVITERMGETGGGGAAVAA